METPGDGSDAGAVQGGSRGAAVGEAREQRDEDAVDQAPGSEYGNGGQQWSCLPGPVAPGNSPCRGSGRRSVSESIATERGEGSTIVRLRGASSRTVYWNGLAGAKASREEVSRGAA